MNPFITTPVIAMRRTWGQRVLLVLNVVLITASLLAAFVLGYASDRAASVNRVALDRSLTELPSVDQGERVLNVLLVGSDSSANLDPDDPIQIGRQGERLGDVIIIAHLDERDGTVSLLSLPRDLWVPIAGSERHNRINRAFLVGGPATLIDTIEETFDIPIHHYVNVDFAGFQGLVSAVGSVDVHFDTPARDWNVSAKPEPRSQTGFVVDTPGCHSLEPEQALAYVRSRYYQTQNDDGEWVTDPTSDLGRISRQQDFLKRLMQEAIDQGARNPLVLADLIDTAVENVSIDHELTPSLLIDMSGTFRNFDPGDLQSYTFPAVDDTVGTNRVLVPRLADAEPLIALFNGARTNDPATVAVDVVYDPTLAGSSVGPTPVPDAVDDVIGDLDDAGYVLGSLDQGVVPAGFTVRHGPDGRQAAEVLVATLREGASQAPITVEEVRGLLGRNVELAVGLGSEEQALPAMVEPTLVEPSGPTRPGIQPDVEPSPESVDSAPDPLGPSVASDIAADQEQRCG